ncbi:hypothetical protein V8F06_007036 [Rhypophila decipiens]
MNMKASLMPSQLGRQPTKSEQEAFAVAEECLDVTETLEKILTVPEDQSSTWKKALTSVKAVRNRDKLQTVKQKLNELRDQLMLVILVNLRDDFKDFASQLSVKQSQSDAIWGESLSIGKEILEQVNSMKLWQSNLDMALREVLSSAEGQVAPLLDNMGATPSPWPDTMVGTAVLRRFVRHLDFPEVRIRESQVAPAHTDTFEWIFLEPQNQRTTTWHSFTNTLMKYIVRDRRTQKHLRVWGKKTPVQTASFYFWLAGSAHLQHSQEGLLGALLVQALDHFKLGQWGDKAPSDQATAARWVSLALSKDLSGQWSWADLQQMFRFLLEDSDLAAKYCFFIDGLDEFKGDHSDLISFIFKISQYPNVKLCVSSRPWIIFEDELCTKAKLMLQDLTSADVKTYIESQLGSSVAFRELRMMNEKDAESLMESIAEKFSGVFLWVQKLDALPPELDDLFRTILHNFNGRYVQEASALFQIVKASPLALSLLCLSLADEDERLAIQAHIEPALFFPKQRFYRALNMRRRLDSRCKGLLEVSTLWTKQALLATDKLSDNYEPTEVPGSENPVITINPPMTVEGSDDDTGNAKVLRDLSQLLPERGNILADAQIGYLHRTVKNFLDQPDIWKQITSAADERFNPHLALARTYLLQLKWIHFNLSDFIPQQAWFVIFRVLDSSGHTQQEALRIVDVELLDELGRVIAPLFPSESVPGSGSRWPVSPHPKDFLHLMAMWRLHKYLDKKLRSVPCSDQYITSLLKVAASFVTVEYGKVKSGRTDPSPDVETVETLLNHKSSIGK